MFLIFCKFVPCSMSVRSPTPHPRVLFAPNHMYHSCARVEIDRCGKALRVALISCARAKYLAQLII